MEQDRTDRRERIVRPRFIAVVAVLSGLGYTLMAAVRWGPAWIEGLAEIPGVAVYLAAVVRLAREDRRRWLLSTVVNVMTAVVVGLALYAAPRLVTAAHRGTLRIPPLTAVALLVLLVATAVGTAILAAVARAVLHPRSRR